MQSTSGKHINYDYTAWQQALGFYKDELGIFKNRLTEVAAKNTGQETMQQVEHFQNQLLVHIESIDTLRHDIKVHLAEMAGTMQEQAGHVTHAQLDMQVALKDRYETEAKLFAELKESFNRFLTKVM
jgi:hypothetical protein